jgi:hypothetical protein
MSDPSSSIIIRLWQQCHAGKVHETLQFLSCQPAGTANKLAVALLLYSEAQLLHQHHLTADIWSRLLARNLVEPSALDPGIVGRMKEYAKAAQKSSFMRQYITGRWQEDWWRELQFMQVSRGCGIWV